MTESSSLQASPVKKSGPQVHATTLRAQLVWASLFPLATFVLLSGLVATVAFRQLTLTLTLQRDTARVQAAAGELASSLPPTQNSIDSGLSASLKAGLSETGLRLFVVNQNGEITAHSGPGSEKIELGSQELVEFIQGQKPASHLTQTIPDGEGIIVSYAPLPDRPAGLIVEEPWSTAMAQAFYYQLILIGLLILGTTFSLYMLSLSIGRVTGSIARLADNAARAVPGSLFRPMAEQGPHELHLLIKAFNKMVVQLAEQQGSLRQYAHKALLSQEEERQRLSHELHDGTMQDLVGLVQRVELCRSEMDRDPLLARRRLDELQDLIEQILGDVHRISNALRPSILEDLGLPTAIQALCNDLQKQMSSIQCQCVVTGEERRLSPDLELAVFRVVQESLGNIRKHVRSVTRVEVLMEFRESEIRTVVRNDGPVFPTPDVRSLVRNGHLGLAGMYERAHLFHGNLNISSDPATGTTVRLRLPCPSEAIREAGNSAA